MFWRRRKLPAEDEPLVPHGLILQAMEEPGSELPPDMLDSPKDVEQSPAEPVEMRLRVSAQAQSRSQEAQPLPEQDKISPPLKWPRVDESEIARRARGIDTAVSFPYRAPVLGAAVPDVDRFEPEPQAAESAKLEVVETPASPSTPSPETGKLKKPPSRVLDIQWPSLTPLRERIGTGFSQAKTGASSGFQLASDRLKDLRSKSGDALEKAKTRLVDTSQSAILQSRSGLQHVRKGFSSVDVSPASRAWDRVRSWRLTVRIPAGNKKLLAFWTERAKSSTFLVQRAVQRDSRLWASLGMAGLSALLALGLISAVRHYGPDRVEAQPTSQPAATFAAPTKALSSSVAGATPNSAAEITHAKPSPIARAGLTEKIEVAKPSAVVTEKKPTAAPPKKPRVRRNTEEDDYVAKDTYVFYGNSGKPHR